jgi:hypothetical protein
VPNNAKPPNFNAVGEPATPQPFESELAGLGHDERWQLVSRIVQSRTFAKSPRLREFLMFIAAGALTGHAKDLTEVEIGQRIFGKGADFAPVDDSLVRGSARQLRAKLKEFFEVEGASERWLLEIPKGGYVPVFVQQEAPAPAEPAAPAAQLRAPGPQPPQRSGRWKVVLIAAAAINVVLLCLNLWWSRALHPAPGGQRPTLLSAFVPGSDRTQIVVSDFSLVLMYALGRPGQMTLDEYSRSAYGRLQAEVQADGRFNRVFDVLRTHRLTRLGDLNVVSGIQKSLGASFPLVIRHARDASSRDFKTGRHILLGNPFCTPWIDLFEDWLTFPDIRLEDAVGFRNLSPRPGEPAAFMVTADEARKEEGLGYARIAFVPNLSGQEGILLLSGVNMVTMEAAGEFAADPATLPELMRALGRGPKDNLPYFEAILETHAVDNTPRNSKLRTIRLIGRGPAR